eukprot:6097404-Amphidinium_carterae.6
MSGAELAGDYKILKCAGQVEIKVPKSSALDVDTVRSVAKMHNAMGHPDSATLCRQLAQHHARPEAILAAKHLQCLVCLRHARQVVLVPPRATALTRMQAAALGEIISMNIFIVNVPTNDWCAIGMVCHGTLLQQACRTASREPSFCCVVPSVVVSGSQWKFSQIRMVYSAESSVTTWSIMV